MKVQGGGRQRVARYSRPAQDDLLDHAVGVERHAVLGVVNDRVRRVEDALLDLERRVPGQIDGGQRQVQVTHVEERAQVDGGQLQLTRSSRFTSAPAKVVKPIAVPFRSRVVRFRASSRMPSERQVRAGEHPILELDPAARDREVVDADVDRAGG